MKKIELLSPVSNIDTLINAINGGADAVYLGGNKFSARAFSKNFNNDDMIEAIRICRLYGVKIYVALNTIIYEDEVEEFIEYTRFLHTSGVDAVIMQDIGMINLVHTIFPNLEIHSSTQMHNINKENINTLKEIGVKRVVCARELSLDEIHEFTEEIEIEAFVHGSLCISYSGQCYASFLGGKRSANRGECTQSCRLKYSGENIYNKHVLSTKDLCTVDNIDKIIESGITSLKIEGRMKSGNYIYLVTKLYRGAIDSYLETGKVTIDEEVYEDLQAEFNRGYTKGFILEDANVVNDKRNNHKGIKIGEVINIDRNYITIKLSRDLYQNDGIKFEQSDKGMMVNMLYDNNNNLINKAFKGDTVKLDNKIELSSNDNVLRTIDSMLNKRLSNIVNSKRNIELKVKAHLNEPLEVTYMYMDKSAVVYGNIVESAMKLSTSKEEILSKLSKLGDTIYRLSNYEMDLDDNVFISASSLNNLRREAIDLLNNEILKQGKIVENSFEYEKVFKDKKVSINFEVNNEIQMKYLLEKNIGNIYINDLDLYNQYKDNENVYYNKKRLSKFDDNSNVVIQDFNIPSSKNIVSNYYLNVVNSYSVNLLGKLGVNLVCVSIENSRDDLEDIYNSYVEKYDEKPNLELVVYGKIDAMMLKYDLLSKYNLSNNSIIKNVLNTKYEVTNMGEYTLLKGECIDMIDRYKDLYTNGLYSVKIILNDENNQKIEQIISNICN